VNEHNRTWIYRFESTLLKHQKTRECERVGSLLHLDHGRTARRLPRPTAHWQRALYSVIALALGCSAHVSPARDASTSGATNESMPPLGPVASDAPESAAPDGSSAPSGATALLVSAEEPEPEPELAYLSPSRVGAAVRARQAEFLACHALADLESRRGPGSVTVGWLVDANGSVAAVQLGRSSFESDSVNECVLAVARSMSFPRSPVRTQVSWTVKFQGAAGGSLAEAAAAR
jgi:hypothetical protein